MAILATRAGDDVAESATAVSVSASHAPNSGTTVTGPDPCSWTMVGLAVRSGRGVIRRPDLEGMRVMEKRLTAIEEILPTLATKNDLAPLPTRDEMHTAISAAVKPLASRDELDAAIAPLATREELRAAIAPLATREEMYHAIREEGERTRRHFDVVAEDLRGDIRLLAEGQVALYRRDDGLRDELKGDVAPLDRRVTRLEAKRG